jgi:membrane protein required for colicin V production
LEVRVNWLDLALLLTLLLSTVSGLSGGFARTGVGFLATLAGLVFGLQYFRPVSLALRPFIHESGVANAVGFLIVFCAIVIAGGAVSRILSGFIRTADLTWLDRLMGAAFGVVRGVLLATVVIWGLMAFPPAPPKHVLSTSRLAPCVMEAARRVAEASPEEVRRSFRQSYRELNKVLPENIRDRLQALPSGQI